MLKKLKMPSSYTSSQKNAIAQFVGFTQVKDSVAAKVEIHQENYASESMVGQCRCILHDPRHAFEFADSKLT